MSDNKLNVLVAYPYMKPDVIEVLKNNSDDIRFLLDSGAFTAWKAGKSISVDDYCRFLESLPIAPWRYFTLDVIGDPGASMKNYEILLSRGFKPIPIFTRGEDPSVIEDYYKTSDVVGIGGLVGTERNKGFVKGIMNHVKGRRVHWLGFTSLPFLKVYKPYMCDSSSWAMGVKFGTLSIFDGNEFVRVMRKNLDQKQKTALVDLFHSYGENAFDLMKKDEWVNSGRNRNMIENISIKSYVRYSLAIRKHLGTEMFLAAACGWQVIGMLSALKFWRKK